MTLSINRILMIAVIKSIQDEEYLRPRERLAKPKHSRSTFLTKRDGVILRLLLSKSHKEVSKISQRSNICFHNTLLPKKSD